MAPTTPLTMTAQEALETLRRRNDRSVREGMTDGREARALAFLETALSDAERRATDAEEVAHYGNGVADLAMKHRDEAESRLSAVEARCGLMREFARWAIAEGAWEGGSLDGGEIQDKAVELGLLNATKYDPAIHGDNASDAEPGDEWFVYSSILAPGGKSDQGEKEKGVMTDSTILRLPAGGEGKPEPVAWMIHRVDSTGDRTGTVLTALSADHAEVYRKQGHDVVPLYTAPLSRSGDSALVEAPGNYQAQAVLDERLTVVDVSEEMNLAADLDDCRASLNREAGARVLADDALAEALRLLRAARVYVGAATFHTDGKSVGDTIDKFIQQHGERK